MIRSAVLTLLVLLTIGVAAAAEEPASDPATGGAVLIAKAKSPFKDALVEALAKALTDAGFTTETVALAGLAAADPAKYRAIVVVTMAQEWGKTKTVPKFLEGKDAAVRAKLVVFTTARKDTWKPKPQPDGVDAISGASKKDTITAQVAALVAKVQAR